MEPMNRRYFITNTSLAVGSIVGAGMLLPVVLSQGKAFADDNWFMEARCGSAGRHVLVTYESLCGSTSEVAVQIGKTLCRQGIKADVLKIDHVRDIRQYDAAVIGSAVKSSAWHKKAIDFVKDNQGHLSRIPVAYFLTCLALYHDTPEARKTAAGYFNPVLKAVPDVKPLHSQAFAGTLDYSKMNMIVKMIMKSKMKEKGVPAGDFRDFKKIEEWALTVVSPAVLNS